MKGMLSMHLNRMIKFMMMAVLLAVLVPGLTSCAKEDEIDREIAKQMEAVYGPGV